MQFSLPAWLGTIGRAALVVLIPVVLTLANVRLLMTPLFPEIEYRLPGFPDDPFGFTREIRLRGSKVAIDFLVNGAGIDFLSKLHFADVGLPGGVMPAASCAYVKDGDCTRFYNDRELSHMVDVKTVTRVALAVWTGSSLVTLLAAGALYFRREWRALRASLLAGAILTALVYLGLLTYIAVNFGSLFVQFHEVFFAEGTWSFLWTDSLIRMFPVRFWQDAFVFVSGASVLEAGALAWLIGRIK